MLDTIESSLAPDSLLRALPADQLETFLKKATTRQIATGETIIEQGDEDGDFAVYLVSGTLKISFVSAGGREIILSYAKPGEVVGEIALLDSGPRTATVTAAVPSAVLILPTDTFLDAIATNPASVIGLTRELARRVRELNLVVESDRTFSMGPRLARALMRLVDAQAQSGALLYNPSQSDLGAFAGLARENVSRLLSDWEEQGVIAREGKTLEVRDPDYLQGLAEFGDDA
ncbi:MAG: Crp/Fnr family transcriptional regulator [Pseudomonadota bacterium]